MVLLFVNLIVVIIKNKIYSGIVLDQGKQGEGIVYIDQFPIYIPNVIPGDDIQFKILKVEKRRAFARLQRLIKGSADRTLARCSVADQCGGCQLQHQSVRSQLIFKSNLLASRLGRFIDISNVDFLPMIQGEQEWATRNKMQFAFAMGSDELKIGLSAARSHRVIDLDYCHVMSQEMNDVLKAVKTWHAQDQVPVYDERSGYGVLRHMSVRYSYFTREVMIILTTATDFDLRSFREAMTSVKGVVSLFHTIQGDPTDDRVLGRELHHVWGKLTIDDEVYGIKCQVSPRSFMQANALLVNRLYEIVFHHIKPEQSILDLYCGTGVMTCAIAQKFMNVRGVDNNSDAIKDAKKNADRNNVSVDFYCQDVTDFLDGFPDLSDFCIILDPPRQGCSEEVLKKIGDANVGQLIYISCYPDTLGRDLRLLCNIGFQVESIQGVDMFCHTPHIEAIASLKK